MKKLFGLSFLLLFSVSIFAQNIIEEHFQYLVDSDESTVIHVAGLTFQLASNFVDEEEETQDFLQSIESFDLVAMRDSTGATELYRTALSHIGDEYDELLKVKDKEGNFSLFIDEEDGVVYELVGTGAGTDDFVIFTLVGEMRLDQIGEMINKIDDQGFEALKEIDIKIGDEVKVYPNPVNSSGQLSIDIPDEMLGGTATVYDPSGAKVQSFAADQNTKKITTENYNPGYYVVSIEKDGTTIKKKVLVVR